MTFATLVVFDAVSEESIFFIHLRTRKTVILKVFEVSKGNMIIECIRAEELKSLLFDFFTAISFSIAAIWTVIAVRVIPVNALHAHVLAAWPRTLQ